MTIDHSSQDDSVLPVSAAEPIDRPARPPRKGMFGAPDAGDTSGFGGLVRPIPVPVPSPRPYGGWFDAFADELERTFAAYDEAIEGIVVDRGELTLHVRREHLLALAKELRDNDNFRFEFCSAVSGVHYPDYERPLHVVYHLLSMSYRRRIRLEVAVTDPDPHVPSMVPIFPTADWQERETYDLLGIIFDGHPGLTRIFMPDDWVGHPQRKDYPLGGINVEYKGAMVPPPEKRRMYGR